MTLAADFEIVVSVFTIAASVLYGAGALWVLCGRSSSLAGWLLLLLALSIPLRISANEIFLVHAVQVVSVIVMIKSVTMVFRRTGCGNRGNDGQSVVRIRPLQTTIRGLMFATLVFALLVDNLRHATITFPQSVIPACIVGFGLALSTLLATATIWTSSWPWLRWPACSLAGIVVGMVVGRMLMPFASTLEFGPLDRTWFAVFSLASLFGAVQLYLLQQGRLIDLRSLIGHDSLPGPLTHFACLTRTLACVGSIFLVTLLGIVVAGLSTPLARPTAELPTQNAYDVFVRAGKTLTWNFKCPWWRATGSELRDFCRLNQQQLQEVQRHVHEPCQVPLPHGIDGNEADLKNLQALSHALLAHARLAMIGSRDADAAISLVDVIELGMQSTRGGLQPDLFAGCRMEAIGLHALCALIAFGRGIDHPTLLRRLKQLDFEREAPTAVMLREEYWIKRADPWWNRFSIQVGRLTGTYPDALRWDRCRQELRMRTAKFNLLLTVVALEAFHAEFHRFPAKLEELRPRFVDLTPIDPFGSAGPLIYRLDGDTFLLYSVGENGVDDGGKISSSSRGDLFLDAVWSTTRVTRLGSGNLLRQSAVTVPKRRQ